MRRRPPAVLGTLLTFLGAVWTLQGAKLLGGSFMTGSRLWLAIGVLCLVAGIALLARALHGRAPR